MANKKGSSPSDPVEARLSAVSAGLEDAAAELQALVAKMKSVLEESGPPPSSSAEDGNSDE